MSVKIIECPRDAMQGLHDFIPTANKIRYLNSLLKVGYDTLDFGSFVSPKAIPQMRDTAEVLESLENPSSTKLLAIVANFRGAEEALRYEAIRYIGFPFSVSETFQLRNTNTTIVASFEAVKKMQELCVEKGKELVIYISMGFGNPYGDPWNAESVEKWVQEMNQIGVTIVSLSDTVGVANPESIQYIFSSLIPRFPNIEMGAHLHTTPDTWREKVEAAYLAGCRRFDGAIKGLGGCPMAADTLTGNMPTERLIGYFDEMKEPTGVNKEAFYESMKVAMEIFTF